LQPEDITCEQVTMRVLQTPATTRQGLTTSASTRSRARPRRDGNESVAQRHQLLFVWLIARWVLQQTRQESGFDGGESDRQSSGGWVDLLVGVVINLFHSHYAPKGTIDMLLAKPIHDSPVIYKYIGRSFCLIPASHCLPSLFSFPIFLLLFFRGVWFVLGCASGDWFTWLSDDFTPHVFSPSSIPLRL